MRSSDFRIQSNRIQYSLGSKYLIHSQAHNTCFGVRIFYVTTQTNISDPVTSLHQALPEQATAQSTATNKISYHTFRSSLDQSWCVPVIHTLGTEAGQGNYSLTQPLSCRLVNTLLTDHSSKYSPRRRSLSTTFLKEHSEFFSLFLPHSCSHPHWYTMWLFRNRYFNNHAPSIRANQSQNGILCTKHGVMSPRRVSPTQVMSKRRHHPIIFIGLRDSLQNFRTNSPSGNY